MFPEIQLIQTNGKPKTVKEKIVKILSFEWPLTTKEIFSRVKKDLEIDISYQATHKALSLLLQEGVLHKDGKNFSLKKDWIKNLNSYLSYLNRAYIEEKKYSIDYELKEPVKVVFNDISEFTVQIATWFADKSFIKEGPEYPLGIFRHAWWPSRFNFKDFQLLLKVVKNNKADEQGYALVKFDTPFDKWILNQYTKAGFKGCKRGVKIDYIENDFFIHGDVVFQAKLSEETKQFMDEYYTKIKNLQNLYHFYTNKKDENPHIKIELTIMRNKEFADTLRNIVFNNF